jgi:hypothetical protein
MKPQPLFEKIDSDNRSLRTLLRSIDPEKLPFKVSKGQLACVVNYIEVLAFECSDGARRGQPSNKALAEKMRKCERSVQSARRLAEKLGLVRVETRLCDRTGRTLSNWQVVQVDTIRSLRRTGETTRQGGRNSCRGRVQRLQGEGATVAGGGCNGCTPLTDLYRKEITEKEPPPPNPNWEAISAELAREGVGIWESIVALLRKREIAPEHALKVIEYYRANRPGWSAGALVSRLKRSREDLAITDGWPPKCLPEQPSKQKPIDRDGVRCTIAREWKSNGRWMTATNLEIEAEIDRRVCIATIGREVSRQA